MKKVFMQESIDSVGLTIHTKDGKSKEIPLEVWQVDAVARILGLSVNLSNLNDYKMAEKETVEEYLALLHDAVKSKISESSIIRCKTD